MATHSGQWINDEHICMCVFDQTLIEMHDQNTKNKKKKGIGER